MVSSLEVQPVPTSAVEVLESASFPRELHPAAVYLARLGKQSQRVMSSTLEVVANVATGGRLDAERMPWHLLRYQHTGVIRAQLSERFSSAATINRHLYALRGVLKEAWKLGHMNAEDYHRAVELPAAKGETLPVGRELSEGELRNLFAVCGADPTPAGARDAALLAILYGGGLRRSEATSLDAKDFDPETGELRVRHGKGNKQRLVYLAQGGRDAIRAWLQLRDDADGPLLCPVRKGGSIETRRMTDQAVLYRLRRRAKQANVAHFTAHDLRRSFISHLLDAGGDISTVQQLAGHASVTTTQRYDRRGEATKRKAASLLHVPYVGSPPLPFELDHQTHSPK